MTKRRKTKSGSKKKTEGEAGKVINITNCQTVQVGQTNISTVLGDDGTASNVTVNAGTEKCLLVIKNLLKDRRKSVTLEELQECVEEILQKGDSKPFEELCKVPLRDYLLIHNDTFRVFHENRSTYVSLRSNSGQTAEGRLSDHSPDATDIAESTTDDWCQVNKKRTKRQRRKEPKPLAREIIPLRIDEDPLLKKFKDLIGKKEDRDLMFVSDHTQYIANPGKCMQDIVSMWNTPQRTKSHIVIGVEKTEEIIQLHGTDKDFDITFYAAEKLFSSDLFTMRPIYQCVTVVYDSKTFVIIEIACSCGKGQPSIVKRSYERENVSLKENELWYRRGSKSFVCPPTDLTIGSIYQWFIGATSLVSEETLSTWESLSENKNAISTSDEQTKKLTEIKMPEIGKDFAEFWQYVNAFKSNNSFILLSGDVSNQQLNLAKLSLVDWVAVFDFDIFSCSGGLFNAVQDSLEARRHVRIGTWREPPPCPTEDGTYWCFLRGRREISETRTDSTDGLTESAQSWFKIAKSGLIENCEQLASFSDNYAVFTVVILWPQKEELVAFIKKFLDRLVEILTHTPRIVVCLNEEPVTEMGQSQFKSLCYEYHENIHICKLSFSKLCLGIGNHIFQEKPTIYQKNCQFQVHVHIFHR